MKIYDALQLRAGLSRPAAAPIVPPPTRQARTGPFRRTELVSLYQTAEGLLEPAAPRILELMSAAPGEGTSTIARELATAVAEAVGRRVLLVTMTRGNLEVPGNVAGTLLGDDLDAALIQAPGTPYLSGEIGVVEEASAHLFETNRIHDLFQRLQSRFDVILIDAPPVATQYAGLALVRHVGGVILVIEAERTRAPIAEHTRRQIEANGGHVLGVVLNKRRMHIPQLLYKWL